MEAAPHQRDIAAILNQALRMGEDTFFNTLNPAQKQVNYREKRIHLPSLVCSPQ